MSERTANITHAKLSQFTDEELWAEYNRRRGLPPECRQGPCPSWCVDHEVTTNGAIFHRSPFMVAEIMGHEVIAGLEVWGDMNGDTDLPRVYLDAAWPAIGPNTQVVLENVHPHEAVVLGELIATVGRQGLAS
jgi:hypothetical protein